MTRRDEILLHLTRMGRCALPGSAEDIDDAKQETAIYILGMAEEELKRWFPEQAGVNLNEQLIPFVRNRLRQIQRKEQRHHTVMVTGGIATTEDTVNIDNAQEENAENAYRDRELVLLALTTVTPRHAGILRTIAGGGSIRDYSRWHGLSYGAAKQIYHRAKASLRRAVMELVKCQSSTPGESGKMSPGLSRAISAFLGAGDTPCTETLKGSQQ